MNSALRGRWRLSGRSSSAGGRRSSQNGDAHAETETETEREMDKDMDAEAEGDVHVETEGVDAKYMYKMQLSLRSAGRASKNNKLTWRGFWSYNKLTDDWAPFALKNDRAFLWSRVRSYGVG